jgi:hypothetical protein
LQFLAQPFGFKPKVHLLWPMTLRTTTCAVCNRTHSLNVLLRLDCHGELELLDPSVLRCKQCGVKHGVAFGTLGRATALTNMRDGKKTGYSDPCVLSKRIGQAALRSLSRWRRSNPRDLVATLIGVGAVSSGLDLPQIRQYISYWRLLTVTIRGLSPRNGVTAELQPFHIGKR